MPPKKSADSKKKKAKGKEKEEKVEEKKQDKYDDMNEEDLATELAALSTGLQELRRNRNFYQIERDEIQQFYDIVHQQVQETTANIKNIESQMERLQETHRNDIRIYMQKVIHLEYEHHNNVDTVEKQLDSLLKAEDDEHLQRRHQQGQRKLMLQQQLEVEEKTYEEEIKTLQESERKEMEKLREEFEKNHQELQGRYEERLGTLKNDLELRRKMEIHEIEERKNRHIQELMRNHEKAFNEMRNYYNSTTRDNLQLIRELQADVADLRAKSLENDKTIQEVTKRNEMLSDPLRQAQDKVSTLKQRLQNYEKDKGSLKLARTRVLVLEEKLKGLRQDHAAATAEYNKVQAERDMLSQTFEATMSQVQLQNQQHQQDVEAKLAKLAEAFEHKKAQFGTVLKNTDMDPVALHAVSERLHSTISAKNEAIRDLNYERAKLQQALVDLRQAYESTLEKKQRTVGNLVPDLAATASTPSAEQPTWATKVEAPLAMTM